MKIKNIIDNSNIKLTTAREEILSKLINSKTPQSYDDIKDTLSMDKATFYRNISKFEQSGIVQSFESNDKKRYFEITNNPHGHFICETCNKVECLSDNLNIKLDGYKIENIIIKGVCKSCNL